MSRVFNFASEYHRSRFPGIRRNGGTLSERAGQQSRGQADYGERRPEEQGAEQLLGQGDLLFMPGGGRVVRVHGPFVSDEEVQRVADWLREQGEPNYIDEVTEPTEDDESGGLSMSGIAGASDSEKSLFDQAVNMVAREGKCSVSLVQRHLSIGYNKAAKLVEQMEKEGIVSPANHVGKREILVRRSED